MTASVSPTPGRPEKENVRAMFDAIAPRYDLLNRVLSMRVDVAWRNAAVRALRIEPGARVLDLATGTGDLLLGALNAGASNSAGADLSRGMLRLAGPKLARGGFTPSRVAQADAEALPFASASFDGISIAFGIRNVGDRPRALREMHRVLKPGAPVVVLEFHEPEGPFGRAFRFYFSKILPRVGAFVSGNAGAYAYLPASISRFVTPDEFRNLMTGAGFARVSSTRLSFGIAWLHVGARP